MRIALFVPAPFDMVSGGYDYDRHMVAGLREAGHDLHVMELSGRHPLCDDAARQSAAAAWRAISGDARRVIDGLALPSFVDLADELSRPDVSGLIHHPTALETGFAEEQREVLRATERELMPRLSHVIVTSGSTAERLSADFGVEHARIRVVVPGTTDTPRSQGSGGPSCRILSVGALVPRKGHDLLIRALARLTDLDWTLAVVGSAERDPVHAEALTALAQTLGVASRVRFAGELDEAALEALWRETDLFALATHWEGYGMAVAEALKRGIPVAVTAGGAVADLVPFEAGVVCPVGDQEQLSKALRRVIFSRDLRFLMAEKAWQAGRKLPTWETQAAAFAEALAP